MLDLNRVDTPIADHCSPVPGSRLLPEQHGTASVLDFLPATTNVGLSESDYGHLADMSVVKESEDLWHWPT
jgi:hypothetical protein